MKLATAAALLAILLVPYIAAAQEGSIEINLLTRPRTLARGDDFQLKVILTQNSSKATGASIAVESEIFSINLYDDGQHDDNAAGDGIYANSVRIDSAVKRGGYTVTIEAVKGSSAGFIDLNIFVDPELAVEIGTDKELYQTFDRMTIAGATTKSSRPATSNVTLNIICGQYTRSIANVETSTEGNYSFIYPISKAIPVGNCTLEAVAIDAFGNSGFTVRQVAIEFSEQEIYKLIFLDPLPGTRFKEGGDMKIRLKVQSGATLIDGATVTCEDPFGDLSIQLDEVSGIYSRVYQLPLGKLPDGWSVSCVAQTADGFFGKNFVNVGIESIDIEISVLSPAERTFKLGEAVDIIVEAFYNDGRPLINGNVKLTVSNKTVELRETENPGTYIGRFSVERLGFLTMEVTASDNVGNVKALRLTAISRPTAIDMLLVAIIIIATALCFSFLAFMWRKKRKKPEEKVDNTIVPLKERLKDLEGRRDTIKRSMDSTEKEYYRRKIDEKTFNRLMQDYEEKLIQIDVEIKQLKGQARE
ncbi:MAG: hypothetical protein HY518_00595 [Candidatus Aenigmarchaeota archaeon]|nr:hypothetical protein [Candidatus Aenigmarchaeota archaeon]